MRLIDGTLLSEMLSRQKHYANDNGWHRKYIQGICDAQRELRLMPTIEAEPIKHGRWVEVQRINQTDRMAICECSLCGDTVWVYDGQRTWNYCPNCGAKMDEVEDDKENT